MELVQTLSTNGDVSIFTKGIEQRGSLQLQVVVPSSSRQLKKEAAEACSSVCSFTVPNSDALQTRSTSIKKLVGLKAFYLIAMVVEIIGGISANSLAVLTDAAHVLFDAAGFSVQLFTIWVSGKKPSSKQYSFGYHRLEVFSALISVMLIWGVTVFMICEAVDRILHQESAINGKIMFTVAAFEFIINIVMVFWLGDSHNHFHDHSHEKEVIKSHDHFHHHHQEDDHNHEKVLHYSSTVSTEDRDKLITDLSTNKSKMFDDINIEGAYLHVLTDLIQSVAVMISGAVIWVKPSWILIDLICTILSSLFILVSAYPILSCISAVLMERTPDEVNITHLENGLRHINGVRDMHDLHVWSINVGKVALPCHVVAEKEVRPGAIVAGVREYCKKKYGIHHVTVQVEEAE